MCPLSSTTDLFIMKHCVSNVETAVLVETRPGWLLLSLFIEEGLHIKEKYLHILSVVQ